MWSWVSAILKPILEVGADFLKAWIEDEKKIQTEFKARSYEAKVESMYETQDALNDIREAQKKVKPVSIAEWNKNASVFIIGAILFLFAGCTRTVYVDRQMPPIEIEHQRPTLSETDMRANVERLMTYSLQLEAAIKAYNEHANEINNR